MHPILSPSFSNKLLRMSFYMRSVSCQRVLTSCFIISLVKKINTEEMKETGITLDFVFYLYSNILVKNSLTAFSSYSLI